MYGAISNLFTGSLGYSVKDVDIDSTGESGRPDVTVRAESGLRDSKGNMTRIDWVVVEAKDERDAFSTSAKREKIFEEKSKYIGPNTAWFVMVDPTIIVARPAFGRVTGGDADIELQLKKDLTEAEFKKRLQLLHQEVSGVSKYLAKFREGEEKLIASEKLINLPHGKQFTEKRLKKARKNFFSSLRHSITALQEACRITLASSKSEIQRIQDETKVFSDEWEGFEFDAHSLTIKGKHKDRQTVRRHNRQATLLRQEFSKNPSIARLALDGLPSFQQRTGCDDKTLDELFAIETANMILARVLLIRFFEDHGFFGNKKYVCNGGVEAFQKLREYFDVGYTKLLKEAYDSASHLYASAFDETELDWVIGINDPNLSHAIEWSLFQLSKYDFTTIQGDILTGIYDRFLDRDQRKKLGEFYTPPSIAKYIVDRIGIGSDSTVIDPTCGSGTFLIEAFQKKVGEDVSRGVADYDDVLKAFESINGNDLNVFSAVLSQIQLLWQILSFKNDIVSKGFPDIHVTGKANSLVHTELMTALDDFSIMDDRIYDAVVGNPPYVRAERSAQALDKNTADYFSKGSISPKANTYTLFIYRALDSWCKAPDEEGNAGKLGFIVPGSLFDSNDNDDIRRLFAIGGRWTIKEIVDLEVIWKYVFDAKALPVILIAEARPATEEDIIEVRIADRSCVKLDEDGDRAHFALEGLAIEKVLYSKAFTSDGRILTRLTEKRIPVLDKLRANSTFEDIAKPYWVRKEGSKIVEWTDNESKATLEWEQRRMLAGGIAFRNHKPKSPTGLDVFKGENILAGQIQGAPVETAIDVASMGGSQHSDASLWRYLHILPDRGLAVAQMAHCPNGATFDPRASAFTNTATIFFPKDNLAQFPFDVLLLSNIYVYFYALAARMGALDAYRSHIYPVNFGKLPWNDSLTQHQGGIEQLRPRIVDACEKVFNARATLDAAIDGAGFNSLKDALKNHKHASIEWGHSFDMPDHVAEISKTSATELDEGFIRIFISQDLMDWIKVNDRDIADGLMLALELYKGESLKKADIFKLLIPAGQNQRNQWTSIISSHSVQSAENEMTQAINDLDRIVGKALGLNDDDIDFIQKDLSEDSFLKHISPRYPGQETRKQGFRTGLDSSDRYR